MQGTQSFPQGLLGHKGPQNAMGGPFGAPTHEGGLDGSGVIAANGTFEFRRESRSEEELNGVVGRNGQPGQGDQGHSPLDHHAGDPGATAAAAHNRNSSHSEHGGSHMKQGNVTSKYYA